MTASPHDLLAQCLRARTQAVKDAFNYLKEMVARDLSNQCLGSSKEIQKKACISIGYDNTNPRLSIDIRCNPAINVGCDVGEMVSVDVTPAVQPRMWARMLDKEFGGRHWQRIRWTAWASDAASIPRRPSLR